MTHLNLHPEKIQNEPHTYVFRIASPEITRLLAKHRGEIGIKISKPMAAKTLQQLRAFHPLAMAFWLSGMHSAPEEWRQTFSRFRFWLKVELGPCEWMEYQGSHVPIPKSIADYTIEEMTQLLEGLIAMCKESLAYPEDARVLEIINGIRKETY